MTSYFCGYCGTKTEGNTHSGTTGDKILQCPVCNFVMRLYILPSTLKTEEEIEKTFQDTPLTDSQRGTKLKKRFTSQGEI